MSNDQSNTPELDEVMAAEGEEIARELDRTLNVILTREIGDSGELGAEMAREMHVTQIDYYSDLSFREEIESAENIPALKQLRAVLTEQLHRILAEQGVPADQIERTGVREISLVLGQHNTPYCKFDKNVNNVEVSSCWRPCNTCA